MEHIVQFAISMDDANITKLVEENASKVIIGNIQTEVEKILFDHQYYARTPSERNREGVIEWTKRRVEEFLEENRDAIITEASKYLADKMSRTKAVKEAAVRAVKGE